jgi:hypothetical protein
MAYGLSSSVRARSRLPSGTLQLGTVDINVTSKRQLSPHCDDSSCHLSLSLLSGRFSRQDAPG